MGLASSLRKQVLGPKLTGALSKDRALSKYLGPLFISAPIKASEFKFGVQQGVGCSLPRKNF